MVWLMLTGELPWGFAETDYAQYDRQLHHVPVWPAHIPLTYAERWKTILVDALAPDPARRPQTAQLFALQLAQALQPIPPHVPNGLVMLEKLAPKFLADLPAELETVRHPNGRIEVASLWSPRAPGAVLGAGSSLNFSAIRVSAAVPVPQVSAPTINARPHAPTPAATPPPASLAGTAPPMTTTLSSANGSRMPSMPRARLAAIGIGTAIAATVVIAAVAFGVSRVGSRSSGAESIEPAAATSGARSRSQNDDPSPPQTTDTGSGSAVATPVVPESIARPNSAAVDAPSVDASDAPSEATVDTAPAQSPVTNTPASPTSVRHKQHAGTKPATAGVTKPRSDTATKTASEPSAPTSSSGAGSGSARVEKARFDPDAIKE